MKVKWIDRALDDLNNEVKYISQDNYIAARKVITRIKGVVKHLAKNPYMGRQSHISNVRELIVPGLSYVVRYTVKDDIVEILGVFHTSRKFS